MRVRFAAAALVIFSAVAAAQEGTLRGSVAVQHEGKGQYRSADVVVWLTPLASSVSDLPLPPTKARLVQRNKRFEPHVVVVTVGSFIEFPNLDPYFHNVFSIYKGKPFDLGLYESGAAKSVRFTQPGVSYIFCNIHPEMSAAVVALPTRYFALTGEDGRFSVAHLVPGRYRLQVWYEFAADEELTSLSREVEITPGEQSLPPLMLHSSATSHEHLNKYGENYGTAHKPVY